MTGRWWMYWLLVIRTISLDRNGQRRQYLRYLDRDRHVVGARSERDPAYDPRSRGWYVNAIAAEQAVFSEPFIFFRLRMPGITASRRLIGGNGVVGVAITLANFSEFLSDLNASPNAKAFLFDSKAQILAQQDKPVATMPDRVSDEAASSEATSLPKAHEVGDPMMEAVVRDTLAAPGGRPATKRLELDSQTYLARIEPVGLQLDLDQYVAVMAPCQRSVRADLQWTSRPLLRHRGDVVHVSSRPVRCIPSASSRRRSPASWSAGSNRQWRPPG